mmetsp:Transcript_20383/g.38244  ORF Transcript_20383/g.38244 Transcript_20383/m.38244 type:complete len:221 (+) Transcript_20383:846-1508(+)
MGLSRLAPHLVEVRVPGLQLEADVRGCFGLLWSAQVQQRLCFAPMRLDVLNGVVYRKALLGISQRLVRHALLDVGHRPVAIQHCILGLELESITVHNCCLGIEAQREVSIALLLHLLGLRSITFQRVKFSTEVKVLLGPLFLLFLLILTLDLLCNFFLQFICRHDLVNSLFRWAACSQTSRACTCQRGTQRHGCGMPQLRTRRKADALKMQPGRAIHLSP